MHHRNRQVGSLSSHEGEWNVDITYILMLQRKVMHGRTDSKLGQMHDRFYEFSG